MMPLATRLPQLSILGNSFLQKTPGWILSKTAHLSDKTLGFIDSFVNSSLNFSTETQITTANHMQSLGAIFQSSTVNLNTLDIPLTQDHASLATLALGLGVLGVIQVGKVNFEVLWGKIQEHFFVAASTSGILTALYYSLFVFGGSEDATTFETMLAQRVPGMVIGALLASVTAEFIDNNLKKYIKPALSYISHKLHLGRVTPLLMHTNGMPSFHWETYAYWFLYYKNVIELEIQKEKIFVKEQGGSPNADPEKSLLQSDYDLLSRLEVLVKRYQKKLTQVGEMVHDEFEESIVIDFRYFTFIASSLLTYGILDHHFGAPIRTENVDAILGMTMLDPLIGGILGLMYYRIWGGSISEVVIKPIIGWGNRKFKQKSGINFDVTAGLSGVMSIPQPFRYSDTLDSIETGYRVAKNNLLELAMKTNDPEKFEAWSKILIEADSFHREYLKHLGRLGTKDLHDH